MIRVELLNPAEAATEAERILTAGEGQTSSLDVFKQLVYRASERGLEITFWRRDPTRIVEIGLGQAAHALSCDLELRPLRAAKKKGKANG